ncbi:MAG: hypothetical protein ACOYMN_14040 [Roseimicrobium sp.]
MHAPLFAGCCWFLQASFTGIGAKRWPATAYAVIAAIALAASMEVVQRWAGRTPSMEDFAWGALGAAVSGVWCACMAPSSSILRCAVGALSLTLVLAGPVGWIAQVVAARVATDSRFPLLDPVPGALATFLWTVEETTISGSEGKAAQLDNTEAIALYRKADRGCRAGFDARGRDWSAFTGLSFEGTLQSASPVELGIRVDLRDAAQTVVRAGVVLQPGTHRTAILWPIPLQNYPVEQLVLFVAAGTPPATVTLSDIRLLPR